MAKETKTDIVKKGNKMAFRESELTRLLTLQRSENTNKAFGTLTVYCAVESETLHRQMNDHFG